MTDKAGLLLFAHGARDPNWARPFHAVADRVRALRPDAELRLAFLELMSPDLATAGAELAAAGCRTISVVPLFLGAGGHVRSLILFAEPLENLAVRLTSHWLSAEKAKKVAAPIAEFFLLTLAAQITTLPDMAYHFGQVSLIALIANPFVLPVQPALMVTGGLALFGSIFSIALGKLLALVALPFPAYTIRAVEFFDRFPGA